jgi:hypothetical protein
MDHADMVAATTARERRGSFEVSVLDACGDIAVARVLSTDYVDYLHLARFGDRWQMLNFLWQPRVGQEVRPPRPPAAGIRSPRP